MVYPLTGKEIRAIATLKNSRKINKENLICQIQSLIYLSSREQMKKIKKIQKTKIRCQSIDQAHNKIPLHCGKNVTIMGIGPQPLKSSTLWNLSSKRSVGRSTRAPTPQCFRRNKSGEKWSVRLSSVQNVWIIDTWGLPVAPAAPRTRRDRRSHGSRPSSDRTTRCSRPTRTLSLRSIRPFWTKTRARSLQVRALTGCDKKSAKRLSKDPRTFQQREAPEMPVKI